MSRYFKRLFDLAFSVFLTALLLPLLLLLTATIYAIIGGPALFRQRRPGLRGEPFECLKFRTMDNRRDEKGLLLPDEARLTALGKFLRRTSLDELPQLVNVLRGEMSFVGPRPLLMEYLDLYTGEQMRRHEVKPGITGWAQINGRNAITWEERFQLDVWYVDNQSFFLDMKILLMTIKKVIVREGISARNGETMPKFSGTISPKQD